MSEKGRILRIEKLSTFDGDGLRTVIFLKGCPLACRWCSTPESQRSGSDFGLDRNKCTSCFSCVRACPEQALSYDMKQEAFVRDPEKCKDCRACIEACPTGAAIAWGYTATAQEIFKEVEKDSLFYFHSGGGVTVSGGEPLTQPLFVRELLETCMDHGISTAIETCGQVPWQHLEQVLPHVDTLFYDLKHMDDETHREITGVGNQRIHENLKRLDESEHAFSLIVRMPVIPGCNDQADNIKALAEHCRGLKKLTQVQLLPYHRLGMETYRRMGLPYPLDGIDIPTPETMEDHLSLLGNLPARIGG